MDDLSTKISQILSDPESMNQLRAAASALGLDPSGNGQKPNNTSPPSGGGSGTPDLSALAGLLGGLGGSSSQQSSQAPQFDPRTLNLLQGAVSKLNTSDKNVELLRALKPHFTPARSSKIDDAIRLIQLFSLLPVLRDSGILGGLFGGGDKK